MPKLDVEEVDLAELLHVLRARKQELGGVLDGRSRMRDLVAGHLGCSLLEAEELVDTLIARGFAHVVHDPEGRDGWRLSSSRGER
jgi:hypothetical protein